MVELFWKGCHAFLKEKKKKKTSLTELRYTANKLKCSKVKAHHSYLRPVSGMIKVSDESLMSDVYASTFVLSVDAFFSCLVIFSRVHATL